MTEDRLRQATLARLAVTTDNGDESLAARAKSLAGRLSLPFQERLFAAGDSSDFFLTVTPRRLELREATPRNARPLYVDFVSGVLAQRRKTAFSRKQPIARAVGLRHGLSRVVDATAGLGRDTFLLASLGCTVAAIERSEVLAALLQDGMERATNTGDNRLREIIQRISLRVGDACALLPELSKLDPPEVVYLDPMYTHERKAALAKKEIRICRMLVGDDPDALELFQVARRFASDRVVVKRHLHAACLSPDPDLTFHGTTTRYDVYLSVKGRGN
jgi:16S rRNA (guanine1516-N2)-methyltransferase